MINITGDVDTIEKVIEKILNDLNKCSKLRTLVPFIEKSVVSRDIEDKVIFTTNENTFENILSNILSNDISKHYDFDFLLGHAISKMISIENESIIKYLIDNVESKPISSNKLEETILSHYEDTIILLNPKVAPLIPNAIKIHENLYFINQIHNHIICVDNKDICLSIGEELHFMPNTNQYSIFSFKEITISSKEGIKIYTY